MIQLTSLTRFRAFSSSIAPRSDPSHDIPLGIPNWIVPAGIVNSTSLSFTYLPQPLRVRCSKCQHPRSPRIHRFEPDTQQVRARSGDALLSIRIPASPHVSSVVTRLPRQVTSAPVPPTPSRDARPRQIRLRPARASEDKDKGKCRRQKTEDKVIRASSHLFLRVRVITLVLYNMYTTPRSHSASQHIPVFIQFFILPSHREVGW